MKPDMTDDQERELTDRISKWMGIEFVNCKSLHGTDRNIYGDIIGDGSYTIPRDPQKRIRQSNFKPLTSRDDWALVEEEIERRWLWKEYCVNLYKRLGFDLNKERPSDTIISFNLRRASPLVCAQAWDEMVEYMKHEKQNMTEQKTKTRYRCEFIFTNWKGSKELAVYANDFSDLKDGFWVNEDYRFTKKSDAKYWIPPSVFKYITKDTF